MIAYFFVFVVLLFIRFPKQGDLSGLENENVEFLGYIWEKSA